jgi:similar to stage IV sporulation protein
MGKVEGRTWRTLTAVIPLEAQVKAYSGDEKTAWSVTILGQRVNFSQNSGIPFDRYDKITHVWNCALPGGRKLPISLSRETWREYDTASCSVDLQAAQTMVEEALRTQLSRLLGETGEMVEETFTAQVENGQLQVTLVAECREELGKFIPAESVSEG